MHVVDAVAAGWLWRVMYVVLTEWWFGMYWLWLSEGGGVECMWLWLSGSGVQCMWCG